MAMMRGCMMRRAAASGSGQMAVEVMVVLPVVVALIIVVVDTMVYLGDCARFDRVAAEAVRVHAGSPSSAEYGVVDNAAEVRDEIEAAMPSSGHLSYAVTSQGALSAGVSGYGGILSFIPQPQVYTCALVFSPWPFSHGAFGAHPLQITHRKSFAVDPYRPGVIM